MKRYIHEMFSTVFILLIMLKFGIYQIKVLDIVIQG